MMSEPNLQKRVQFYRQEAEAGSLISADYNQRVLSELYDRLDAAKILSIGDVGSGMGRNLPQLRRRFGAAIIFPVDLSAAALSHGRTAASAAWPAVADALHLPFRDGALDLAVCTEVLEHVADLTAALAELGRVVRPGGHCVISAPNYLNPMGIRKWFKDRRLGHEFWDPWGGHQGFERLMTPRLVGRAVRRTFVIRAVRGAGFLMAWSALGYGRIGKSNDRFPMIGLGRLPLLRHLAMNRYLLLKHPERT